jgi:hypothetical protein
VQVPEEDRVAQPSDVGRPAPAGDRTLDDADGAFEAYVRRWVTARVGACEDADSTAITDPIAHARYDDRLRCFDDLRGRTASVISSLCDTAADPEAGRARIAALPPPESCLAR